MKQDDGDIISARHLAGWCSSVVLEGLALTVCSGFTFFWSLREIAFGLDPSTFSDVAGLSAQLHAFAFFGSLSGTLVRSKNYFRRKMQQRGGATAEEALAGSTWWKATLDMLYPVLWVISTIFFAIEITRMFKSTAIGAGASNNAFRHAPVIITGILLIWTLLPIVVATQAVEKMKPGEFNNERFCTNPLVGGMAAGRIAMVILFAVFYWLVVPEHKLPVRNSHVGMDSGYSAHAPYDNYVYACLWALVGFETFWAIWLIIDTHAYQKIDEAAAERGFVALAKITGETNAALVPEALAAQIGGQKAHGEGRGNGHSVYSG